MIFIHTRVPRPWESIVNERLKVTASEYLNVALVDWYAASAKGFYFILWNVIYIYLIKIWKGEYL